MYQDQDQTIARVGTYGPQQYRSQYATLPAADDVVLTDGSVCVHERQPNGSQAVRIVGKEHGAFSADQWRDYLRIRGGFDRKTATP